MSCSQLLNCDGVPGIPISVDIERSGSWAAIPCAILGQVQRGTTMAHLQSTQDAIEAYVDSHGLYGIVHMLETICYEKAVHLAHNWHDDGASLRWQKAGNEFDKLHTKLTKIQIPGA